MSEDTTTTEEKAEKAEAEQNGQPAEEAVGAQAGAEAGLEPGEGVPAEPEQQLDVADLTEEQILGLSERAADDGQVPLDELLRQIGELTAKNNFLRERVKQLYAANLRLTRDAAIEERCKQKVAGRTKKPSGRGKKSG